MDETDDARAPRSTNRWAAFALFLLAPFCGEFLLGNVPLDASAFVALGPLALIYGGGAVLVREVTRRAGRGFTTLALLAFAYGVVEEGLVTQSLFNPGFLDAGLHDYGPLPGIGMAGPWTLFVLTIHSAWSILLPIALAELLFPARADRPWVGRVGLGTYTALYLLGCAGIAAGTIYSEAFVATPAQLGGALLVAVAAVVAAVTVRPRRRGGRAPAPVLPGAVALVGAGAMFVVYWLGVDRQVLPAWSAVAAHVLLVGGTAVVLGTWSRRVGWSAAHRVAVCGAAVAVYAAYSFRNQYLNHGLPPAGALLQACIAAAGVAVVLLAARRAGARGQSARWSRGEKRGPKRGRWKPDSST